MHNIKPTQTVELLEPPYGKYEVDAVDGETIYLVDSCGTIICHYTQCRAVK